MSDYLNGLGGVDITPITNTDPQNSEAASELAAAVRQLKDILPRFLAVSFEPQSGKFKGSTLPSSSIQDGSITGSNDNTVSPVPAPGKIAQGTISLADLKDLSIATGKIIDQAITAAKIANATITVTQIADNAVETAKIKDANVTAAKLGTDSVTSVKIQAAAVTDAKIAPGIDGGKLNDGTVTGDKLTNPAAPGQLLIAQSGSPKWAAKTVSGAFTIDANGVVTISNSAAQRMVLLRERAVAGTNGGAATAAVDLTANAVTGARGTSALVPWEKSGPNAADVTINADGSFTVGVTASLLIQARAPAYNVGKHKCALLRVNSVGTLQERVYGTSETSSATSTTISSVSALMNVTTGDKIYLRHYVQTPAAATDFGNPTSATSSPEEVYAQIIIL